MHPNAPVVGNVTASKADHAKLEGTDVHSVIFTDSFAFTCKAAEECLVSAGPCGFNPADQLAEQAAQTRRLQDRVAANGTCGT